MHNQQDPTPDSLATQQTGNQMMYIAWIIGIALLVWIIGGWEENQYNPNKNPDSINNANSTEVVLEGNRYGHYIVDGYINQKPVTFLVDTGATAVAIPGQLQQELGLESGHSHQSITANGTALGYFTRIETLKIGEIELYDVKASILPNMDGEEILLGMSVLKQLEFTQRGNQLRLRQYK